ncbi:MAG TPA: hypothetical protein VHK91_06220 [Flavisolibacter sp.]|jgi:hypothetical protein|nr:hypothetical protein [Flavisolibacter sp.]
MKSQTSIWKWMGLQDWFLKKENGYSARGPVSLTPDDVYRYILDKFNESIGHLSFANRIVFYHEYIICFSQDDFKEFMDNKKGIFGLIVHESVKKFYEALKAFREKDKTVEPSSSKWVFRFVSHPDYARGDMGFIGKLLPGSQQQQENLRVTFIPRQTGIAQTFDINPDILKGFTFYSEGYYEVPFTEALVYDEKKLSNQASGGVARLEAIVPDKALAGRKLEYFMKDDLITISGKEETLQGSAIFRIPSEWVNAPHLKIRYQKDKDNFEMASFGEKTILNEKEVERSTPEDPVWISLPVNSRIVLNGIVGVNLFKN